MFLKVEMSVSDVIKRVWFILNPFDTETIRVMSHTMRSLTKQQSMTPYQIVFTKHRAYHMLVIMHMMAYT